MPPQIIPPKPRILHPPKKSHLSCRLSTLESAVKCNAPTSHCGSPFLRKSWPGAFPRQNPTPSKPGPIQNFPWAVARRGVGTSARLSIPGSLDGFREPGISPLATTAPPQAAGAGGTPAPRQVDACQSPPPLRYQSALGSLDLPSATGNGLPPAPILDSMFSLLPPPTPAGPGVDLLRPPAAEPA